MDQLSFGAIVKERRQALGLTQAELARRVGCATVTIRRIEYDTLRPSVQIAERLALALTIPEDEQIAFVQLARAEASVSPLPTPPPAPEEIGQADLSGRAVRGFELSERLGAGGFGVVYRARQPGVEREVAIKLILPRYADHPDFIRRFETEAQLVARLEHPHIVPLYDYWREPGTAYLVMRWLRGGSLEQRFEYGPPVLSAALSPDGSQVWGGAVDGALVGWELESAEPVSIFTGHQAEIVGVAISPDGRYALTAGASDGTARLWNLETGQPGQVFRPEAGFVLDVAFSPDGRYVLASTASGVAFMWPVEGGEVIQRFALDGPAGAPSVAVSPDGSRVAVGSRFGEIALFEADKGQQQRVFSGHTDVVRDLAFSSDGTQLLSASADGTARLWDVATGTELRRYNRRPFTAHSAVFAPDGRTVLVAANDGLARRYDVDYQDTVQYLCRRLQRDFSGEEQAQYEINGEVTTCQPSRAD